jgi:tetratricopeptide (TPR) repeat protein
MKSWLRRSPNAAPDDEKWQKVRNLETELHQLGFHDGGDGYRRRLGRLCDFIRELAPDGAGTPAGQSDLERYESAFATPSTKDKESYLQKLEDLRVALEPLIKTDEEDARQYLARVHQSLVQGLEAVATGIPEALRAVRRDKVKGTLKGLGLDAASPRGTPQDCLGDLDRRLTELETSGIDAQPVKNTRQRWRECVEDCAADWEWAYLQVLARLASEYRKERPASSDYCEQVKKAKDCLSKAIPRMERQGFLQYRTQGLYGDLAAAHLAHAKAPVTKPAERLGLIQRAFTYSRHAVELEPESIRERLVLLDVLSTVGDAGELGVQAEIALNFDSGSETLRTIGASYWDRITTLTGRGVRLRLLREAARFFETALQEVESAPFDGDGPLDQVEAHGWAHFWLGRFQCERGRYAEATAHLRTASALGFKPLESRVELAWAFSLARNIRQGNNAFGDALEETDRQKSRDGSARLVSEAPGEERKIVELEFDAQLGWAFLCAEWAPEEARKHVDLARGLLSASSRPHKEELKAALSEVCGRSHLRQGHFATGIHELEEAVRKSPRAGAYCALGFARLEAAERAKAGSEAFREALRSARGAYRLARESDSRGRYRQDLWELRRRLRGLEGASKAPAAAAAKPAQAGPASATIPVAAQPSPPSNGDKPAP